MNNYQLHNSDCLDVKLTDISCIYLDPPYGPLKDIDPTLSDKYYGTGESFDEYLTFLRERLEVLDACLDLNANILIHLDWKASHYVKVMADKIFGRDNFQNEIVWCYASPSVAKSHLPRKHDTILWYGLGDYAYNQEFVPYDKKLSIGGSTSWNPDKEKSGYLERGKSLTDAWNDIPSLCRAEKEKLGYATQKPMKLMTRIVKMFSNAGETVYDPFCGSGSFLEAGLLEGRNVVGADISEAAIELTKKRLANYSRRLDETALSST